MKRNLIFQSKQQLRGFSEGDFIDRGILLCLMSGIINFCCALDKNFSQCTYFLQCMVYDRDMKKKCFEFMYSTTTKRLKSSCCCLPTSIILIQSD